jgi:hypothetical protein
MSNTGNKNKLPPVFVGEKVVFLQTSSGPKSSVSLRDVEPIDGPEGPEYVFPIVGLSKIAVPAIHPSYLPNNQMSSEGLLALSMRLGAAAKKAISEGKRRLGLFHPGAPRKYWRIQQERKKALTKLRADGEITEREIRDCRARARRLGAECPWPEMYAKYSIAPEDQERVRKAVVRSEKRLYDAARKLRKNRPSARVGRTKDKK